MMDLGEEMKIIIIFQLLFSFTALANDMTNLDGCAPKSINSVIRLNGFSKQLRNSVLPELIKIGYIVEPNNRQSKLLHELKIKSHNNIYDSSQGIIIGEELPPTYVAEYDRDSHSIEIFDIQHHIPICYSKMRKHHNNTLYKGQNIKELLKYFSPLKYSTNYCHKDKNYCTVFVSGKSVKSSKHPKRPAQFLFGCLGQNGKPVLDACFLYACINTKEGLCSRELTTNGDKLIKMVMQKTK